MSARTFKSADDVRQSLRRACDALGGQSRWAKLHDLSSAYVSDVLSGRREPGETILSALGWQRVVFYRKRSEDAQ